MSTQYSVLSALIAIAGALFFYRLEERGLWASHEARAAQHAQVMLDTGDWSLPRLYDGSADLQKPPGYYWLVALSALLAEEPVDAWHVRFPAAFAGLITVLLVYGFLVLRGRPLAGLIAGLVLATTLRFTGMARVARIDMPLTAAITAAVLCYTLSWHRQGKSAHGLRLLAWACAGVAMLLKGPIGLAIPFVIIAVYSFRAKLAHGWTSSIVGPLVLAAVALPWFWWANAATGGELFHTFIWYHNVERALGGADALASHPWWYYVPRFAVDCLPWTPTLIYLLIWSYRCADADSPLGVIWFAVTLTLLSCVSFKRADYLLPLYPGVAIFIGSAGERWFVTRRRVTRRWAGGSFAVLVTGSLAGWAIYEHRIVPELDAPRDIRPLAIAINQRVPLAEPIVLFRAENHWLAFQLGPRVHTLVEWGDLNAWLAQPGHRYVIMPPPVAQEYAKHFGPRLEIAVDQRDLLAGPTHRPLLLLRTADP